MAGYSLTPLNRRHLRISKEGAFTEYRWYDHVCLHRVLGLCVYYRMVERLEKDFDFTKIEDRKRFNDMGFDCSVRERP